MLGRCVTARYRQQWPRICSRDRIYDTRINHLRYKDVVDDGWYFPEYRKDSVLIDIMHREDVTIIIDERIAAIEDTIAAGADVTDNS